MQLLNTGVILIFLWDKKIFCGKIMRLTFEEVIMSDRHMANGQMYLYLHLLFNNENNRLN